MLKTTVETSLGWVAAAATAAGIWCCTLPQTSEAQAWDRLEEELRLRGGRPAATDAAPATGDAARNHLGAFGQAMADYSRRDSRGLTTVPLDLAGLPAFRVRVMQACRSIPPGETRTYAWLAEAAGSPAACRAAGNTMARNPVPLLVPCHRVLRTGGGLGGFGGGLPLKSRLLAHEGWSEAVSD